MSYKIHIGGKCPRCGQPINLYISKKQLKQMLAAVKLRNEEARQQAIREIVTNLEMGRGYGA